MDSFGQRSQRSTAMILKVSKEQAALRRYSFHAPNGMSTIVNTYMGTNAAELTAQGKSKNNLSEKDTLSPMAYLVEQVPNSTLEAHFHQVDQFQIFVRGSGKIGTHDLNGLTVHYAAAYSPYGPIVAGPSGVHYMTLRRSWDPGPQWMPAGALTLRQMRDRKHVAFTSEPIYLSTLEQISQARNTVVTEVIPAQSNGLAARLVQAGPGTALKGNPALSNGLFWYVIAGGLDSEESTLGAEGCVYFCHEEQPFEFLASSQGVELLQLQLPLS